jgi:hypothetical protein
MRQLADNFWNIRGVQRIAGLIDVGTHMSLVRGVDGRFVVVDACPLDDACRSAVLALTGNGALVDAVVHVHPYHTLHVESLHALLPHARLYGTARHRRKLPSLPWAGAPVEQWNGGHPLADRLELSVPAGVDFVCPDERVHVASVLVRDRASGIVHVDDTLNVVQPPRLLGSLLPQSSLRMHPLLSRALKPSAGAADAYSEWALELATRWAGTRVVCAAHSGVRRLPGDGFRREVETALAKVARTLDRHRMRYG